MNKKQLRSNGFKYCNGCKKTLPLSDFSINNIKRKRYKYICKTCDRADRRKHQKEYRDRLNNYYNKIKLEVFNHYSNGDIKCFCCGEKYIEFLTINHINGGGNIERKKLKGKGGKIFYAYLRTNHYPKGYNVLCYNCNCSMGNHGYCPHKVKKMT